MDKNTKKPEKREHEASDDESSNSSAAELESYDTFKEMEGASSSRSESTGRPAEVPREESPIVERFVVFGLRARRMSRDETAAGTVIPRDLNNNPSVAIFPGYLDEESGESSGSAAAAEEATELSPDTKKALQRIQSSSSPHPDEPVAAASSSSLGNLQKLEPPSQQSPSSSSESEGSSDLTKLLTKVSSLKLQEPDQETGQPKSILKQTDGARAVPQESEFAVLVPDCGETSAKSDESPLKRKSSPSTVEITEISTEVFSPTKKVRIVEPEGSSASPSTRSAATASKITPRKSPLKRRSATRCTRNLSFDTEGSNRSNSDDEIERNSNKSPLKRKPMSSSYEDVSETKKKKEP